MKGEKTMEKKLTKEAKELLDDMVKTQVELEKMIIENEIEKKKLNKNKNY